VAIADELLKQHRAEWRVSSERGKILVGLTHILGESILLDRSELDWVVVVEDGFIDDIGLAKGNAMIGLLSRLASLKTFVLGEDGIDLLTWKGFLASENLSEIDQEVPTMTFTIRK
jgi:hypothetical protein